MMEKSIPNSILYLRRTLLAGTFGLLLMTFSPPFQTTFSSSKSKGSNTNWNAIATRATRPADTVWEPIGPTGDFGNAAAGENNTQGRIRSIYVQPLGSDYYLYVGASSGGLWRTRGSTGPAWTNLGDQLPNPSVGAFAVHPDNPDDILVGTGDWQRYTGGGMFHTTNAGQSWTPVTLPVNPKYFFRLYYLDSGNPNVVLAATDVGLLRSTTGSTGSWSVVLTGHVRDLAIQHQQPNIQYCVRATENGDGGGVYRSTDAGQTWTFVNTGAPTNAFGFGRIAINYENPSHVVFVYEQEKKFGGIIKSVDGGTTWTNILGSLSNYGGEAWHALAITYRPNNPNEIYVGANELWKTTDGGQSWQEVPKTIHKHQDYTQLYFSDRTGPDNLWMCNDGGVYRYHFNDNQAVSWNGNNLTGLRVSQISDMDAKRDFRVAGFQDDGVAASNDRGRNWTGYICCDVYNVAITDDLSPTFWYTQDGRVTKQPFVGAAQDVGNPLPPGIFKNPQGNLVYDRFSNKVYSLLGNADKDVVSRPATATAPATWDNEFKHSGIAKIKGSYLNGRTLFVWNFLPGFLSVFKRVGASWSLQRIAGIGIINNIPYGISTVYASTENPSESWAGLTNNSNPDDTFSLSDQAMLLHTTDDWQTWTDITGSLRITSKIKAIAVTPFNAKQIFVGTDIGVYWTQDGGVNWQPFQTGLPIVVCTGLRYVIDSTHNGNDKLVVSTYGHGMYERLIPRPGLVYVDPGNTGFEDGTFEHPYNTFDEGYAMTPINGILALHGNIYSVPMNLNKIIIIQTYESATELRH